MQSLRGDFIMSSIIDQDDKILQMFIQYKRLIFENYSPLDSDHVAAQLTMAHMLDHVSCTIKDLREQQAAFERTKYHIKPETNTQKTPDAISKKGQPNAQI